MSVFLDFKVANSGSINSSNGRRPGVTALPFFGAGYVINNNADIFLGELNTRFSNSANNKLQIGYTKLRDFRSSLSNGNFPLVDILDGNGQPYTSFGYEQYTYGNKLNTDVFQFNDIFTSRIYWSGAFSNLDAAQDRQILLCQLLCFLAADGWVPFVECFNNHRHAQLVFEPVCHDACNAV